jgi:hypothetical protein
MLTTGRAAQDTRMSVPVARLLDARHAGNPHKALPHGDVEQHQHRARGPSWARVARRRGGSAPPGGLETSSLEAGTPTPARRVIANPRIAS